MADRPKPRAAGSDPPPSELTMNWSVQNIPRDLIRRWHAACVLNNTSMRKRFLHLLRRDIREAAKGVADGDDP